MTAHKNPMNATTVKQLSETLGKCDPDDYVAVHCCQRGRNAAHWIIGVDPMDLGIVLIPTYDPDDYLEDHPVHAI